MSRPPATASPTRARRGRAPWGLIFAVFLAGPALRLTGVAGDVAGWLQAAGFAALVLWGTFVVTRSVPSLWGRRLPIPASPPDSAAWLTALNGLLVALAVLLAMSRRWLPVAGDFVYWFSGLPITLAVAVQPRWGLTAYAAASLLLTIVVSPIAGAIFALFTGLLGATSGLAVARRTPLLQIGLWCAAAQVPAQALLLRIPVFHMFGLRSSLHHQSFALSLAAAGLILGLGWMFTVLSLYPKLIQLCCARAGVALA